MTRPAESPVHPLPDPLVPPVHPLPSRGLLLADQMRQDAEVAMRHLTDCQCHRPGVVYLRAPDGEVSNGGPRCWSCADRIVREYRSRVGESWTVEDPHATTPPPVRVIRVTGREDDIATLSLVALAQQLGRAAIEQMTDASIDRGGSTPVENAKLAARFARLALGVSS